MIWVVVYDCGYVFFFKFFVGVGVDIFTKDNNAKDFFKLITYSDVISMFSQTIQTFQTK